MSSLDLAFTQVGLKIKNLVVLDLSFSRSPFMEFRKNYEPRFIWVPCRKGMALEMAGGLASFGKIVVVYGLRQVEVERLDPTLNVKVLIPSPEGSFEHLEERLRDFGPQAVLIPEAL